MPAAASENLIENLKVVAGSATIVDGVAYQKNADTKPNLQWKIQLWFRNENYSLAYNGASLIQPFMYIDNGIGFKSHTFTTPADMDDFSNFVFGLNGLVHDMKVSFDIKDVMPNTTYTIQWRVLNDVQGEIAWTDMRVVHCEDGYSLALGDENCSRPCENQPADNGYIPPDVARVYETEMCTYTPANLVCDDGYARRGDMCAQLCTAGVQHIKTGNGLSFNLYRTAYSVPAIHVKYNETVCYGALEAGAGRLNVKIGDTIYHAVQ